MRLRKAVFCLGMGLAALTGQYVRADEIEALMSAMNQPKIALVLQKEQDEPDEVPEPNSPTDAVDD